MIDTYETLLPLDTWLRTTYLPELPDHMFIVLASRNPPSPRWLMDPGWQSLVQVIPLRNLSPNESTSFLEQRGLPSDRFPDILNFTHGHPLALSITADVFAQRGNMGIRLAESPNVVKTLVERFIQQVPGPAHLTALEACALVRVTTEALLNELLEMPVTPARPAEGTRQLFDWLRGLSFIDFSTEGLFPHDLAREALTADLRWRNPDWYTELHRRSRNYYTQQIEKTGGQVQQRFLMDLVYLHRENATIRSFFEFQVGGALPEACAPQDYESLCTLVQEHEGQTSAKLARYWFEKQPQGVTIWRNSDDQIAGFLSVVSLHEINREDQPADPAIRTALTYLAEHVHLRSGEAALYFRFWMASDTYQSVAPVQSLIFLAVVKHYLSTPRLAFTLFPCANADFWAPMLAYANLVRLPDADFQVDEHFFGVYGHDWRIEPPAAWLANLADKEMGNVSPAAISDGSDTLIVLSKVDFEEAVRQALHDFTRPDSLGSNLLLRSRLIVEPSRTGDRIESLRALLLETAERLRANPRDEKLYRAVKRTYFVPAPTQEMAAELLDLPFSTYRRHLTYGVKRLTEILWEREISGKMGIN
jgi:hypothetical protein